MDGPLAFVKIDNIAYAPEKAKRNLNDLDFSSNYKKKT